MTEGFVLKGGFEDREILEGFKRLVTAGTEAGRQTGAGFEDQLNRFGKRSIASLQEELGRLQSRQLRLNVDSEAFAKTAAKIKEVQALIEAANRKKLALQVDNGSLTALQQRLSTLQSRITKLPVDSKEFKNAQLQADSLQRKIADLGRTPIPLNSIAGLQQELARLQSRQLRLNIDSTAFVKTTERIKAVETQIAAANQKKLALQTDTGSLTALQQRLTALQSKITTLPVDSRQFRAAQLQAEALQKRITDLGRTPIPLTSVAGLRQELERLQSRQLTLAVDSSAYRRAQTEIEAVQAKLTAIERKRLLLTADPQSIVAMKARLEEVQTQLQRVGVGSQEFRKLEAAARAAEAEIEKVANSGQSLSAMQGIVQGITQAITQQLLNALSNLVTQIGNVTQTLSEFDDAGAAIRTLGLESEAFATAMRDLSAELDNNISQVELLKASYDVASSGFTKAADAAEILKAASLGASGGFSDLNTVANASTSVINAYGLASGDAEKIVDGFIQTQNDGKIVVAEYAQQIGRIAPIAAAAGVNIDELNAAVSASTAQGVGAEQAFTGLRTGIAAILKPTGDAAKLAAELGIEFNAQALKAKGLGGVLKDIADKTKGNVSQVQALLGSQEALAAIQPLLGDGLQKYNVFLRNQANAQGVAAKAAAEAAATMSGAINRLNVTVSNAATQGFAQLAPAIAVVVNALSATIGFVGALPGPVKVLAAAVVTLTAAWIAYNIALVSANALQAQYAKTALPALFAAMQGQILGAAGALRAFTASLTLANATAAAAALPALVATLAAVAAAAVGVGVAFAAYRDIVEESEAVTKTLDGPVGEVAESLNRLKANAAGIKKPVEEATTGLQGFLKALQDQRQAAGNDQAIVKIAEAMAKLDGATISTTNELAGLNAEINKGGPITAQQAARLGALRQELQTQTASVTKAVAGLRAFATAQEAAGNTDLAARTREQADALAQSLPLMRVAAGQTERSVVAANQQKVAVAALVPVTDEQRNATKARIEAESELNKIIAAAPVRQNAQEIGIATKGLELARVTNTLIDSRYALLKAGNDADLAAAEKRKAGTAELNAIKRRGELIEAAALQAKIRQQGDVADLELDILNLKQKGALLDADLSIATAKYEIVKATADQVKAERSGDPIALEAANKQLQLAQTKLGLQEQSKANIIALQPLEQQIAAATAETARNQLAAEAASKGLSISSNGTLLNMQGVAFTTGEVVVNSQALARNIQFAAGSSEGISGSLSNAGVGFRDLNSQSQQWNQSLNGARNQLGSAVQITGEGGKVLGRISVETKNWAGSTRNVADASASIGNNFSDASTALANSKRSADGLATASNRIQQFGRGSFSSFSGLAGQLRLSGTRATGITASGIDDVTGEAASSANDLAGGMGAASRSAASFYNYLNAAANVSTGRFAGGDVLAGNQYKINELGQESLLANGRLSLINRRANALWTAPSSGVVIPAGITASLKAAGAFAPTGPAGAAAKAGPGGTQSPATMEAAIRTLAAEVRELRNKDWNLHIRERSDRGSSRIVQAMGRMS